MLHDNFYADTSEKLWKMIAAIRPLYIDLDLYDNSHFKLCGDHKHRHHLNIVPHGVVRERGIYVDF